ncbi:acyl-CoA thioester hydrolase [Microcella putealis]|uniref:Acyl-CoA thioester hydrolase n=1 Tax=Microcella putealis TaxID=337005 RepID=A0A4Q7LYC9_9MICO|nr:thioesterase family protein [Microcella putealis]RZS59228.1 acyl-CoA thioester hydrolase [Microcella putealis]TQM24254.1 acyl-CoA thioester hydrolase [Microcella putealis]
MSRVSVDVPVRWSDLDAYGHVNNAALLTLLEEARISAFWAGPGAEHPTAVLESGPNAPQHTVIAAQRVEYRREIPHLRDPLEVSLWIGRMGGASLEVHYEVLPPREKSEASVDGDGVSADRLPYAVAATTLVLVDAATGAPTRIPSAVREVWEQYTDAPVAFRN